MMKKKKILISVIMPVYNTKETFLREAVESILAQTYQNFEFLIIDDGSGQSTKQVLRSYKDSRISIISQEKNQGVTKCLNTGLSQANGSYIARMDSDDVALPHRFEKQLAFMEKNKTAAACGGIARIYGKNELAGTSLIRDKEVRRIRLSLYNEGIVHPTAFIRKSALGGMKYDESFLKAQDYELWTRLIERGNIEILPEIVLLYRVHDGQISRKMKKEQDSCREKIQMKMLNRMGVFSREEKKLYLDFANFKGRYTAGDYWRLIKKLERCNHKTGCYDRRKYRMELNFHLYRLLRCSGIKADMRVLASMLCPDTLAYFAGMKKEAACTKKILDSIFAGLDG